LAVAGIRIGPVVQAGLIELATVDGISCARAIGHVRDARGLAAFRVERHAGAAFVGVLHGQLRFARAATRIALVAPSGLPVAGAPCPRTVD